MIDDEKDLNEVLLGHDELSEDDETVGDLLGADPDPEAIEDEMIDLNSIAFEDDEEEEEEDDDFEDDDDDDDDYYDDEDDEEDEDEEDDDDELK